MTDTPTITTPDFPAIFSAVHGFLSLAEAELLYRLASEVPAGGVIVEIGNYQGRSAVCLGLGAKVNGARVYTIDPHEDIQVSETVHYGMENHAALLKNLVAFEVADVVRVVALPSMQIYPTWLDKIFLLWIDGNHDYSSVQMDLNLWSRNVPTNGKIAMHDTSGHYPDVTRALDEILAAGQWDIVDRVDATSILQRVKQS